MAGSVAFTVGLTEFPLLTYQPYFVERLCKHRAEEPSYGSWGLPSSPPNENQRDQEWARQCQEALWALVVSVSSPEREAGSGTPYKTAIPGRDLQSRVLPVGLC